jgi:hypothetical protein
MVNRVLLAVSLLLLPLLGCEDAGVLIQPDDQLTWLLSDQSLQQYIDTYSGTDPQSLDYKLELLQTKRGNDLLFLIISDPEASEQAVVIIDEGLSVLGLHVAEFGLGTLCLEDAAEDLILGKRRLDEDFELDPVEFSPPILINPEEGFGFSDEDRNIWINLTSEQLQAWEYSSDWSFSGSRIYSTPAAEELSLQKITVLRDINNLVLFSGDDTKTEIIRLDAADFPFDVDATVPDYPFDSDFGIVNGALVFDNVDPSSCHYTQDGIAVIHGGGKAWLYDFAGERVEDHTLDGAALYAFGLSGKHYYKFSITEMKIAKYRTWWKE